MPACAARAAEGRLHAVVASASSTITSPIGDGVIEDVAEARCAARAASNARAPASERLLADGEQQLDVHRRALAVQTWRASASSTATAALLSAPRMPSFAFSQPPSSEHRLDRRLQRHRVEVRAQQQRRALAGRLAAPRAARAGSARAGCRSPSRSRAPASSSLDRHAERAQLGDHALGAGSLAAGGALDPAQLGERAVQIAALERADVATRRADGGHRTSGARRRLLRCSACSRPSRSTSRPRAPAARSQRGGDEVAEQRRRALRAGLELRVELGGDEERVLVELDRPRPGARRARCPETRRPGALAGACAAGC